MDAIVSLIIVIMLFMLYFTPSYIGNNKKHCNGIFLLNLFFGWTLLGWVAALIWAVSSAKEVKLKKCHSCAESVNIEAKKCKHCGEVLEVPVVKYATDLRDRG